MLHKLLIISVVFSTSLKGFSQQYLISSTLVARLDSVTASANIASHFAELYLQTTIAADLYIQTLPPEEGQLMKKLEQNFAEYFFRAIVASNTGNEIPGEWKNYKKRVDIKRERIDKMIMRRLR